MSVGGESLEEQRRRLQREVQLLEQSLNTADLTQLSSDSDESDSSEDSTGDQDPNRNPEPRPGPGTEPGPGPGPSSEELLLEQRDLLHREIQELERTLGPTSPLTQHHTDEEEGSSSSDESEMELPPSLESCLQMNLVYQQVIQETLEQLERLLQQNDKQQKELMVQLSGSDRDQSKPKGSEPVSSNLYLGNFLKPYFKDRLTGLGPPSNEETKEKNSRLVGSLDYKRLKTRRWEGWQKVLLIHAVSRDRLRKLIQPKISRLDFLTQKLSTSSDSNKAQISEQIQVLEKDIQALREKKEEELIGDRFADVDWDRISNIDFEGSREPGDLQCFWQNFLHPVINKKRWSDEEISKLKELSLKNQERDWTRTSEELGTNRTAFMCLQTYQRFGSKSLRKRTWTREEDAQLRALVDKMRIGNFIPYTQMCYFMEDRLPGQLLYRWSQVLDPRLKRGPWSPEEDQLLLAAIEKYGAKHWWKIRYEVPGRTDCACRDRYYDCLKPDNKKGPFDERENLMLRNLVQKHGYGRWSKIAAEIPNRTDAQCMRAYKKLLTEAGIYRHKETREGSKETGEEMRRREKVTAKDTEKTTKRERNEAEEEPNKLGKETVKEEGEMRRRQSEDSSLALRSQNLKCAQTKQRKRRRRTKCFKDVIMSDDEEEQEEVPYMDISDEDETKVTRDYSEKEQGRYEEAGPEEMGAEPEEPTGAHWQEQTATVSWVRLDLDQWLPVDHSRRSPFFKPVSLCEPDGGSSESVERCTILEKSVCSEVTIPRPTEVSSEENSHENLLNAPLMITAEDLSVLLQQQARKFSHRGRRLTEMSLSYRLQAVMVPWVGHVIVKEPTQELPRPREGLNQGSSKTGPGPNRDLSSSSLFRFFLHVLRVDAEGCKRTIEERRRRAELRSRTVADILKMKQIKQEVTRPSLLGPAPLQTSHAPPQAGHMYLPVLLSHNVAQSQNVRLAPPPGTQSSAPLVTPQNMQVLMHFSPNSLSPQTLFTVAPSVWTQHGQVPTSSSSSPLPPLPTFSSCPLPPLPSSSSSSEAVIVSAAATKGAPPSSETQNVRPAPPSFTQSSSSLLTAPPQNVQGFLTLPPNPTSSLAPPSVFTVMAPGWTQHGRHASSPLQSLSAKTQNVLPNSPNSLQNVRPLPFLSPSKKQNVRPLPFLSPSKRQNVRLFRDSSEAQKVHVVKVYPASPGQQTQNVRRVSPAVCDQKKTDSSSSDADVQVRRVQVLSDSDHINALSDHDYAPRPNHSKVPSSNQITLSASPHSESQAEKHRGKSEGAEEDGAEEEQGKRRRKPSMKALALHRDKVEKQKKRLSSEKKHSSKRRKTQESSTAAISLLPTSLPSAPLPPTSLPSAPLPPTSLPSAPLPPTSLPSAPLPPTFVLLPPFLTSYTPLSSNPPLNSSNVPFPRPLAPLLPPNASLPSSLAPSSPSPFSFTQTQNPPITNPPITSQNSSGVLLTELCDWLGAGQHELKQVSHWLRGERGVSVEGSTVALPYLPPFICNLKALKTLLQKRAELHKNAVRLLPKTQPSSKAEKRQTGNHSQEEKEREEERDEEREEEVVKERDGSSGVEQRASQNSETDGKPLIQTAGCTNEQSTNQIQDTEQRQTNQTPEAIKERANETPGTREATNDITGTSDDLTNEHPRSTKEPAHRTSNQTAGCRSEPLSNQEPIQTEEEELTEAVRQIVREHLGSHPAHQLLKARFLSIFTLPALLASLQPITEQHDSEEPITDQQENEEPITDQQENEEPITDQQDAEGKGPKESQKK
ncbi:snRNA-activating protein complex subunit 4 [Periophthalmus magnuspinnatus]|uniref:snRNA-activating protein complex subunit 4 n=1 Tax=Periophthalmus magnuspinnatus TaxID=409849 RepID=UPI00243658C3|nr:snRNA-activating protein complex subunit 4 [Periophthalmus magnuspinnatus]